MLRSLSTQEIWAFIRPLIHTHSTLNTYRFHTEYQRQIKDGFIFINIFKTFFSSYSVSSLYQMPYVQFKSFHDLFVQIVRLHLMPESNIKEVCGCDTWLGNNIHFPTGISLLENFCRGKYNSPPVYSSFNLTLPVTRLASLCRESSLCPCMSYLIMKASLIP